MRLLRPGRAAAKAEILDVAAMLREHYGAERIAAFMEEAAEVYEQRGLFRVPVLRWAGRPISARCTILARRSRMIR